MFEDSLFDSQGRIASVNCRWTTIASLTLQCSLAAAVLAVPLLYPNTLTFHPDAPKIFLQLKLAPIPPRTAPTQSTTASLSLTRSAVPSRSLVFTSSHASPNLDTPSDPDPVGQMGFGNQPIPGSSTTNAGPTPRIAVASTMPPQRISISSGVSVGLLLAPIRPVYPRIAIATRTEGTVIVEAVISKLGTIESVHATSGSPMLRDAAVEAVRNARYSPYLLNGIPTEVQTTITVRFRLGY